MKHGIAFLTIVLLQVSFSSHGAVWYVDQSASGQPDGQSWATAFTTIQEAIYAAAPAEGEREEEVWIAAGTYDEARPGPMGALVLNYGIQLYGGFAGGEDSRDQRNWKTNVVVIDGSRAYDGGQAGPVIVAWGNATLDGCTVTGGMGGLSTNGWPLTVANCAFRRNQGSALFMDGFAMIVNCVFSGNAGSSGAAATAIGGTFSGCTFSGNAATTGGAIYVNGGTVDILGCSFTGNRAATAGGAIYTSSATTSLVNCVFQSNSAASRGGAVCNEVFFTMPAFIQVTNCTFAANFAPQGRALYNYCDPSFGPLGVDVVNSILWDDPVGDEMVNAGTASGVINYSVVQGGFPGLNIIAADPGFPAAFFSGTWAGGGMAVPSNPQCLDSGDPSAAPATDILGTPRPQGSGVDMGAYEFLPGGLVVTAPSVIFVHAPTYLVTGTAPGDSMVTVTGGAEPAFKLLAEAATDFAIPVPLRTDPTYAVVNILAIAALDRDGNISPLGSCTVVEGPDLPTIPATLHSLLVTSEAPPPLPPHVPLGGTLQFTCMATLSDGSTIDATGIVMWQTTNDDIVQDTGFYINTAVGDGYVRALLAGVTSNVVEVADGKGEREKATNYICGSVKDRSNVSRPPIAGATVKVINQSDPLNPITVATMTANSAGSYSSAGGITCGTYALQASATNFRTYKAYPTSNATGTLTGYFALWPTSSSIPPGTQLFSTTAPPKKAALAGPTPPDLPGAKYHYVPGENSIIPVYVDSLEIEIGGWAYDMNSDLVEAVLTIEGEGYSERIDLMPSLSPTLTPEESGPQAFSVTPKANGFCRRVVHLPPQTAIWGGVFCLQIDAVKAVYADDGTETGRVHGYSDVLKVIYTATETPLRTWPLTLFLLFAGLAALWRIHRRRAPVSGCGEEGRKDA